MRNSIKKTLAMLSAASMVFAGVAASAMSASAADVATLSLAQVVAKPGEVVPFTLTCENTEAGFAGLGAVLNYDENLTPTVEFDELKCDQGEGANGMTMVTHYVLEDHSIALVFGKPSMHKMSGVMGTVYFTVPEDAEPGTKYDVTMAVNQFGDDEGNLLEYEVVNGWIQVETPTTATTTVTTDATTAAATTTTTATTTVAPAVTTAAPVTKPADTGADNTAAALGLAGLLTAAAAAVVLKKKN